MIGDSGTAAAGSMWARRELARRWPGLVSLGLLAGLAAAVALAAIAGARRTDTSFDRLRDATDAADAVIFASQVGIYDPDWTEVAALPYVAAAGSFGLPNVRIIEGPEGIDLDDAGIFHVAFGDWRTKVDRPVISQGRQPDPENPHEVLVPPESLDAGVRVGDHFVAQRPSQEQIDNFDVFGEPLGDTIDLEVVGVGRSEFEMSIIQSDGGGLMATPAFGREFGNAATFVNNLLVRFEPGQVDVERLERDTREIFDAPEMPVLDAQAVAKRVTNGTRLESQGLTLFGLAVAAAATVLIGQALTRSVRAGAGDLSTLQALGFTRREAARTLSLPHLVAVGVAATACIGGAVLLAPLFPIGLGRKVDPDLGFHADWLVLGVGALLLVVALGLAISITAWREAGRAGRVAHGRESLFVRRLSRWGAPVVVTTGARLALEPGSGKRALPTRPALAGAVVGVLGIIGAFTLSAGIEDALTNPERIGASWDMEVVLWGSDLDAYDAEINRIDGRDDVEASMLIRRGLVVIDDVTQPTYATSPRRGTLDFVALRGRAPGGTGEIALGPSTATSYGVELDDTVVATSVADGSDVTLRVVGIGLLPTTPHSSYDQGAWVTDRQLDELMPPGGSLDDGDMQVEPIYVASLTEGTEALATVDQINAQVDPSLVEATATTVPTDLINMRNVRSLPILFGVFTMLLAIGTMAHVSASVVRRRGADLAILRTLGMTPRQTRLALSWQAMTVAAVGLVIGVPLGIIAGRTTWRWVAEATPMVYVGPVALIAALCIVPAALLVANALAFWPGRHIARSSPAEVLRTE